MPDDPDTDLETYVHDLKDQLMTEHGQRQLAERQLAAATAVLRHLRDDHRAVVALVTEALRALGVADA